MKSPLTPLALASLLDGISFLFLLGVAMPLKYLAAMPLAVRIAGSLHGALFLWLGWLVLQRLNQRNWPFSRAAIIMIAAVLPFGPFVLDRRLREWEKEAAS